MKKLITIVLLSVCLNVSFADEEVKSDTCYWILERKIEKLTKIVKDNSFVIKDNNSNVNRLSVDIGKINLTYNKNTTNNNKTIVNTLNLIDHKDTESNQCILNETSSYILVFFFELFTMLFVLMCIMATFECISNRANLKFKNIQSKTMISSQVWFRFAALFIGSVLIYLCKDLSIMILICVAGVLICLVPRVLINDKEKFGIDMCFIPVSLILILGHASFLLKTKEANDTLFSFLEPHITACVGWVTFWAFWAQIRANSLTVKNFKEEKVINQYFEMIKIHRENINNIDEIFFSPKPNQEKKDKKIGFEYLKYEFEIMFSHVSDEVCKLIHNSDNDNNSFLLKYKDLINRGDCNYIIIHKTEKRKEWFELQRIIVRNTYYFLYEGCKKQPDLGPPSTVSYDEGKIKFNIMISCIFNGCRNELTHYYRNLFQTVKYIANQNEKLFNYEDKRDKLRMLRAQMNNHEQLMLFYNWFSGYGKEWENASKHNGKNKFLTDYRIIHNLHYNDLSETIFLNIEEDDVKKELLNYLFSNLGEILGDGESYNYTYRMENNKEADYLFEFEDWK